MADVKNPIVTNSYVKWSIANGGMGVGQVLSIKEDTKNAVIETPTGLLCDISIASLLSSTEEEYDSSVEDIIQSISRKSKKNKTKAEVMKPMCEPVTDVKTEPSTADTTIVVVTDDEEDDTLDPTDMVDPNTGAKMNEELAALKAKVKDMQTKCDELNNENATLKAAIKEADAAVVKAAKDAEASKEAYSTVQAKLEKIEKAQIAQARFTQLKDLDAIAAIADTDEAALAELTAMADVTFAAVLKASQTSFKKLTDMRSSNKPALTDQNVTNLPQKTDASEKEVKAEEKKVTEEAVANAKVENDATLVTAGNTKDVGNDLLSKFAEGSFSRNRKINSTKSAK